MTKNSITKDMIPVEVLKAELTGCQFAIQCDMGNRYDYERIRAIKNILQWIDSPSYQERLSQCGFEVTPTIDVQDVRSKINE